MAAVEARVEMSARRDVPRGSLESAIDFEKAA